MGHHYVPQKYLSRFADPGNPKMIWLHDKQGTAPKHVGIPRVAQSGEFYTPEEEVKLADLVETPADPPITKLIAGDSLTDEERVRLALYIAVMIRRVPYRRRRIYESIVPKVLSDTINDIRNELIGAAHALDLPAELVKARLAYLDEAQETYVDDPPERVHAAVRQPWPTPRMVTVVYDMAWRVLRTDGPIFYVTSDNPAFYFEGFGLGTEGSELTFPLSTTHCLHGSWQGPRGGLLFLDARQSFVKEANRRLASSAERFAFYHEGVGWIRQLLQKRRPYLSQIKW